MVGASNHAKVRERNEEEERKLDNIGELCKCEVGGERKLGVG